MLEREALALAAAESARLPFANGQRPLIAYPQKRALLVMTERPVQLETPFHIFNDTVFTPNDAFFVRWHLADVPTSVDGTAFRIRVHGRVKRPLELDLGSPQEGLRCSGTCCRLRMLG